MRKEAVLLLFADRKIPAGKAARELGMERIPFMELLKLRGIPDVIYTAEDWEADASALQEFEKRRSMICEKPDSGCTLGRSAPYRKTD